MVHASVWMENPDGVFAQDHRLLPYVRVGIPAEWGAEASLDAAYGVALLGADACRLEVRRTNWLAVASWRQRRNLAEACVKAAEKVRAGLAEVEGRSSSVDATGFNAVAEQAWQGYLRRRAEVLTDEQVARLAVGIEHPHGHGEQQRQRRCPGRGRVARLRATVGSLHQPATERFRWAPCGR